MIFFNDNYENRFLFRRRRSLEIILTEVSRLNCASRRPQFRWPQLLRHVSSTESTATFSRNRISRSPPFDIPYRKTTFVNQLFDLLDRLYESFTFIRGKNKSNDRANSKRLIGDLIRKKNYEIFDEVPHNGEENQTMESMINVSPTAIRGIIIHPRERERVKVEKLPFPFDSLEICSLSRRSWLSNNESHKA